MLLTFTALSFSPDQNKWVDITVGVNIDEIVSIEELTSDDSKFVSENGELLDSGSKSLIRLRDSELEYISRIPAITLINQYMSNFKNV